jgi:hypothetical protein
MAQDLRLSIERSRHPAAYDHERDLIMPGTESSRRLPLQLRQILPASGVGFSADWVSRKQGGELTLGTAATQAP